MANSSGKGIFYLLVAGFGMLAELLRRMKKSRLVSGRVVYPTTSAPQGLVALEGFAWPIAGTSPSLEGHESVYVAWTLEEYRDKKWKVVATKRFGNQFLLCDAKGLALVELSEKSTIDLEQRYYKPGALPKSAAAAAQLAFGARFQGGVDIDLFGLKIQVGKRSVRIGEIRIPAGSPVYVAGDFHTSNTHPAHRKLVLSPKLREFRAAAGAHMQSAGRYSRWFDTNKDGKVCEFEAQAGFVTLAAKTGFATQGSAALAPALPDWASEREPENTCHGSIRDTAAEKVYVSDSHRVHLLPRIRRGNLLRFLGGLALIAFGLLWLFGELGVQGSQIQKFLR